MYGPGSWNSYPARGDRDSGAANSHGRKFPVLQHDSRLNLRTAPHFNALRDSDTCFIARAVAMTGQKPRKSHNS